jgi:3-oxoacyl-(acyl-carrier-protein) synthase/SAM-dependent methyltransferase
VNGEGATSPVREAIATIRALRARLQDSERRATAPVAIIGMSCRFPGADDPASLWRLLAEGGDAIADIPSDRWNADDWYDPDPDAPGRMSARQGGFLKEVADFDAAFFGISDREAVSIDPQHRILLEVAWEAVEDAGLTADALFGSPGGVFVGISSFDYASLRGQNGDPAQVDAYHAAGVSHAAAAGRIAYYLGLRGPALSIDTACSSSLAAIHLACQSLRLGECGVALAGGINLILSPEIHVTLSKARMMAPDGRCKAFDAAADGFVRSEGCGVIVLKPLDDAVRDGDRIHAVIRGSACNQDGRSSGLSAPNGPAQTAVVKSAWRAAGLRPEDVAYVEAHGTGTALGDPIEAGALAEALEDAPAGHLLAIGSIKTNLGHMEAAAGVGGLIKTVLALENETLPASLHFRDPSPSIDWPRSRLSVVSEARPWPREATPRRAGVSSFGLSGTNVHIVVEEAPLPVAPAPPRPPRHVWSRRRYWFPTVAHPTIDGQDNAASPETAWRTVVAETARQADQVPIDLNLHTYRAKYRALETLASAYIVRALVELGAFQGDRALTGDDLVNVFGVSPLYRQLLDIWLGKLAGEGSLIRAGAGFVAPRPLGIGPVAALEAEAEAVFADESILLDYVKGCGALLTRVLKGEISALETLFPGGGVELAEGIYHRAALSRYFNGVAAEAARSFVAGRPGKTPTLKARILEVGGGTGGVTGPILSRLPAGRASYTFTDVSAFFFDAAARRFAALGPLEFAVLDLERPPAEQGFHPGSYDLIVAANVLHATTDLGQTLDFVRSLLVPGGALLLYEVTDPPAYFDVSIALIEGWGKSSDDIRGIGPLLNTDQWKSLLPRHGFDRVEAWPAPDSPADVLGSRVFMARANGAGANGAGADGAGADATASAGARLETRPASIVLSTPTEDPADDIRAILEVTPNGEHRQMLVQFVRRQVGIVLRRPEGSEIPGDRRLMDLGLDSLMAIELRNALTRKLGLAKALPATLIFDHPSISDIAGFLLALIDPPVPPTLEATPARPSAAARLSAEGVAALSDADIERLLDEKLARGPRGHDEGSIDRST